MIRKRTPDKQAGFTIVELMIATAILSTILLLVTTMMINIGNLYYKGVNQARVQDGVRTLADDVGELVVSLLDVLAKIPVLVHQTPAFHRVG